VRGRWGELARLGARAGARPSTDHPAAQGSFRKRQALPRAWHSRRWRPPIPGRSQPLITLEPVWTTCILSYFMAVSGAERVASGRSRWGAPGTQRRSVDGDVELMRGLRLVETSARAGPSVGAGDVAGT